MHGITTANARTLHDQTSIQTPTEARCQTRHLSPRHAGKETGIRKSKFTKQTFQTGMAIELTQVSHLPTLDGSHRLQRNKRMMGEKAGRDRQSGGGLEDGGVRLLESWIAQPAQTD